MMALQTVQWTMLYRNRKAIISIAAFLAMVCTLFFSTNAEKLPQLVLVVLAVFGVFAYLILFGVFIHQDADVGTKGSCFPVYLFSLPVRTWQLVLVPMVLGTITILTMTTGLLWAARQGGANTALFWPSFTAAAILAMLQATFWFPFGFSCSKLIVTLIGIPLVASFVGASLTEGVSESNVCIGLFLFILIMMGLAFQGVSRARKGEGELVRIDRIESNIAAKQVRWLKPFSNAAEAQRWYEWRQHGIVLPCLTLFLFGLFVLPLGIKDTYTPLTFLQVEGSQLVPTIRTYVYSYFLALVGLIPAMAWIIGCGARRSDVKHADRTLQLFFGVRPMSDHAMVAQKYWAALKCSLVSWGLILIFGLLLLGLKGGHFDLNVGSYVDEELSPILANLRPYLTSQIILAVLGALLLLIATTWRNYAVGYWIELSGIPWLNIGYPFGTFFVILVTMVGSGSLPRSFQQHWITPTNICIALWVLVAIKFAIALFLVIRQIRSGSLRANTLIRGILTYLVVGSVILFTIFQLTAVLRETYVRSDVCTMQLINAFFVGLTLFWIPVVRILLAPMMLSRNRHRIR